MRLIKKSLWISLKQNEELKKLEVATDLSQSEHMRRALDMYFQQFRFEGGKL